MTESVSLGMWNEVNAVNVTLRKHLAQERDKVLALHEEVERLRALMTPPVDALQVVGLGQARLLIASLNEKVERLRAIETRARDIANEPGPTDQMWLAREILGEG